MRDFIIENKITFEEGNRNSAVTTLIGYAQFKDLTKEELKKELSAEIEADSFIDEEIDRLWTYCKINTYRNFWTTAQAKAQYIF